MIVKRVAQVDYADNGLGRNSRCSGNGVEENGVLIAVALLGL